MGGGNLRNKPSKRNGFTLIELLAVIVILAIISLIAVPQVIKILNKARISAALDSSEGYIKAVENKIVLEEMKDEENKITDGTYLVKNLNVDYKGKGPSSGVVVVEKMNIKNARLCINNYSVDYDGEKSSISDSSYCDTDPKLIISVNGNEEEIALTDSLTYNYTLTNDTLNSSTNISCNNSAVPSIDGNSLKIDNVYGNTLCSINKTLKESIDNADTSLTNIIMINDEELSDSISILENKNIVLDMNGKTLLDGNFIMRGTLSVKDNSKVGKIIVRNSDSAFNMGRDANLYIYYVNILQDYDNSETNKNGIWLSSGCTGCNLEIKDANIDVGNIAVGLHANSKNSSVNIFNGIFNSENKSAIINDGTNNIININGGKFYSHDKSNSYPTIYQKGDVTTNINGGYIMGSKNCSDWRCGAISGYKGTININGSDAVFENEIYKSGLYVESTYGITLFNNGANTVINGGTFVIVNKDNDEYKWQNLVSSLNSDVLVNGGNFYNKYGDVTRIQNNGNLTINDGLFTSNNGYAFRSDVSSTGILTINGGTFNSETSALFHASASNYKICGGNLNGKNYDIYNDSTGIIYYKKQDILNNNSIYSKNANTVILDPNLDCSR